MKRRFSFKFVLLGIIAILVFLGGGIFYLSIMKHTLWTQSVSNMLQVSIQSGKIFETYIEQGSVMLNGRANNFAQYASTNVNEIGKKLDLYEDGDPDFAVIDLKRGIIYYNNREKNILSEEKVKKILSLPKKGILEPFISEYTGRRVIAYYERFKFADGVDGIVRKTVLFTEISKKFVISFYDGAGFSYIINDSGDIMLRFGSENGNRTFLNVFDIILFDNNTDEEAQALKNAMLEKKRGVMQLHFAGKDSIFAFLPLAGTENWYLVSTVPNDVIMEHANKMMKSSLVLVIIVFLALFIFIVFIILNVHHRQQIQAHEKVLAEALKIANDANEAKSTFLANMSHDIRTPMNAIIGLTTLLQRDINDPQKVHDHIEKISSSSQHLLGLINDVLDMSKIETGKASLNMGEFNLLKLIGELEHIIVPQTRAKKQDFKIETKNIKFENLIGDKQRISQVMINILSNAIKYTHSEGNINFIIRQLDNLPNKNFVRTRFIVQDNGIGMSEEYQKEIFQPFTREIRTTVNQIQGTGLGMAITKNLVELMGGTISLESKVGEGSTFIIDFDLKISSSQEVEQLSKEQSGEENISGLHLLCAEDNELNAEILIELLDMKGVTADIAENGQIALEKFESSQPGTYDAILMDVQMPIMNGYEATRSIRSSEHFQAKTIPIIAMTANAFADDVKDAMEAGMNAHIAKPLDMKKLVETLSEFFK